MMELYCNVLQMSQYWETCVHYWWRLSRRFLHSWSSWTISALNCWNSEVCEDTGGAIVWNFTPAVAVYRWQGVFILWRSGTQDYRVPQAGSLADEGDRSYWQAGLSCWVICRLVALWTFPVHEHWTPRYFRFIVSVHQCLNKYTCTNVYKFAPPCLGLQ